MDATKLDYTLTNPQSSRYTQTSMVKNQERQVLFSVSALSSQLETNSFDLTRNFGPLSVAQLTQAPYPYPRPCDIVLSPDQHRVPCPQPQEAPLTDVTTYIYDSGSSYPPNPQPSQLSYHLSSGHEAFHSDLHENFNPQSVSLSINSSLNLAIQSPPAFPSVPSNYSAVRRYHQHQSRQHAQVLHQLTRSRDGRCQSTDHATVGNDVLSASLEITPTGRRAEFYHAASSIPMSNIRLHQPRPPEHASHQLHSQHCKPFNQFQYPYFHDQDLGYPENYRSEPLDGSTAHTLTDQDLRLYKSAQKHSTSTLPESTKTIHIPSPSITNSSPVALESNVYTMLPGPRSNAIQSISQPSTNSFEGTTGASEVHPTTSISDVASITSPPVLTNDTSHDDVPSGITEEESNLIEIESENGDEEEEVTTERRLLKEEGMENVVSEYPGTSAKRRDRKQSEGSGATGRRKTGDSKNDPLIKDLSPPTKKRKKSKMHECQVCHKNFPRPSGLKTHMNTHNNERPYPCPYPGCNRSFGVRSNAKRHLRTHGVIPPQSTGTQPYVVDFSTPMVLGQDGRLGLNGGEGTDSNLSREDDDDDDARPEGIPRPTRPGRGRGRQFKLRWMPPSSSRSAVTKGRGKKKPTNSPSIEPELQDVDVKPSFSCSRGQKNIILGRGREDQEGEDADADAQTDGEADAEMDFGDQGGDQDDESEAEEGEEEFGASTAMRTGTALFRPLSFQHSQASSSRTSLSSSLSGSTSTTSLPLSAPPSGFTSASPIRAEYFGA